MKSLEYLGQIRQCHFEILLLASCELIVVSAQSQNLAETSQIEEKFGE